MQLYLMPHIPGPRAGAMHLHIPILEPVQQTNILE